MFLSILSAFAAPLPEDVRARMEARIGPLTALHVTGVIETQRNFGITTSEHFDAWYLAPDQLFATLTADTQRSVCGRDGTWTATRNGARVAVRGQLPLADALRGLSGDLPGSTLVLSDDKTHARWTFDSTQQLRSLDLWLSTDAVPTRLALGDASGTVTRVQIETLSTALSFPPGTLPCPPP